MGTVQTEWIEALLEQHGRMVFTTAWRVLGDPEDAEDVLQEVFLKALEGRFDRQATRDWGAMLRVAASRCAIDALRRKIRRRRDRGEMPLDVADPAAVLPDEAARQHEQAAQLRQALMHLPERDAQVFVLRHFEELSYDEIAQRLGCSVGSVGVQLHRARKRLRALLEPQLNAFSRSGGSEHVQG